MRTAPALTGPWSHEETDIGTLTEPPAGYLFGIFATANYDKFLDARSLTSFGHVTPTGGSPSATATKDYSTLDNDERTTIARLRGTAAAQLSLVLRGDLDWIAMRCIERDRTRRYDTANGLAMDIQRYLRNEPVIARPPSTAYLLQKAFRRQRLGFVTAPMRLGTSVIEVLIRTWEPRIALPWAIAVVLGVLSVWPRRISVASDEPIAGPQSPRCSIRIRPFVTCGCRSRPTATGHRRRWRTDFRAACDLFSDVAARAGSYRVRLRAACRHVGPTSSAVSGRNRTGSAER